MRTDAKQWESEEATVRQLEVSTSARMASFTWIGSLGQVPSTVRSSGSPSLLFGAMCRRVQPSGAPLLVHGWALTRPFWPATAGCSSPVSPIRCNKG